MDWTTSEIVSTRILRGAHSEILSDILFIPCESVEIFIVTIYYVVVYCILVVVYLEGLLSGNDSRSWITSLMLGIMTWMWIPLFLIRLWFLINRVRMVIGAQFGLVEKLLSLFILFYVFQDLKLVLFSG